MNSGLRCAHTRGGTGMVLYLVASTPCRHSNASFVGKRFCSAAQCTCTAMVYNPGGLFLSSIQIIVPTNREFFYLGVPSCRGLLHSAAPGLMHEATGMNVTAYRLIPARLATEKTKREKQKLPQALSTRAPGTQTQLWLEPAKPLLLVTNRRLNTADVCWERPS